MRGHGTDDWGLKGGHSFEEEDGRPNFLRLFELARVLVRFDDIASFIVNANHGIM
jgi:hypothetical protein